MKHFYYLLSVVLLTPFLANAQSNYKPGYVVALNGDTLKGYVDYKEWAKNPTELNFKKDIADNQKNIYTVNNCNAFAVNGFEYYRRFVVSVSQDKVNISNLSVGPDTTATTDTVFLRLLSSGKNVSLYSFNDALKERFFIAENNTVPVELIQRLYLSGDESSQIVTQKTYIRQLQQLAAKLQLGDGKLINDIPAIRYDETSLKKIISRINGSSDHLSQSSQKRGGSRFFAGIGASDIRTQFIEGDDHISSCLSIFPEVNFGTDFFVNKNVGDLIIRLELTFTANKVNLTGVDLKFDQYTTTLNPQMLYNFYNTKTIKLYVAAGGGINFSSYRNKINYSSYPYGFPDVQLFYFNLTTKAGLTLNNKFDIYVGYNPTTTINDNIGTAVVLSSFHAGINYLFGVK